jgi:Ca2+-binding EF-hand superfamily protein
MLSEFQRSKINRRFELLDADGDGSVTAADFDLIAASVCEAFGFAAGSAQHEKVHLIHLNLWVGLSRGMDAEGSGRMNREQFAAACVRNLIEAEGGYEQVMGQLARTVFELVDADEDGRLTVEELTRWYSAYGVCEDDARHAFEVLDRNGDGELSLDEVHKAMEEYYVGDDPDAPGNQLFGPLPGTHALSVRERKARMKAAATTRQEASLR